MKIPLTIVAIVLLLLAAFMLLAPPAPNPGDLQPRTDLPWQVRVADDGSSRVFDLDLGSARLADAMDKFGGVEGLAVFESDAGELALEAYFGNVRFGPLRARVIVALAAATTELATLRGRAGKREGTPSGAWKYPLADTPAQHAERPVKALSYIPATRNLDADFLRQRFGEPAAWRRESEHAVSWFYPDLGLSILIDSEAREVFEYVAPRDFVLPDDATAMNRAPTPAGG